MRFAFFYFMKKEPERIKDVVPLHVDYWHKLRLDRYLGGPFTDRTGGLITFEAKDLDEAVTITDNDPFVTQGLLESRWTKEWVVKE